MVCISICRKLSSILLPFAKSADSGTLSMGKVMLCYVMYALAIGYDELLLVLLVLLHLGASELSRRPLLALSYTVCRTLNTSKKTL